MRLSSMHDKEDRYVKVMRAYFRVASKISAGFRAGIQRIDINSCESAIIVRNTAVSN